MRFRLTVGFIWFVFLVQFAGIGLDTWQLMHFSDHSEWLMALDCAVIPVLAYNAWCLPKTLESVLATERKHREQLRRLAMEMMSLDVLKQQYAEWLVQEREAIIAHINSIEAKHPEHAAELRRRMAEAERVVYGNH